MYFLACYNGLFIVKIVDNKLEVLQEVHFENQNITFIDFITDFTFLLSLYGEEKVRVYRRAS